MSALYFYDDARARQFEPFALTRPASELRAGTSLIRKRWERATALTSAGFIGGAHLEHFQEGKAPPFVRPDSEIPAGSIVVNSRCIVPLGVKLDDFDLLMCDGIACAVRLARTMRVAQFADGALDLGTIQTSLGGRRIQGRWINDIWDLIGSLTDQLSEDIPHRAASLKLANPTDLAIMGT